MLALYMVLRGSVPSTPYDLLEFSLAQPLDLGPVEKPQFPTSLGTWLLLRKPDSENSID